MILDRTTTGLVHCSLLGGVTFGELFVWFVCGLLRRVDQCGRPFSPYFILFYFWLCAPLMSFEHFVVA
jgi:hypothetical protein